MDNQHLEDKDFVVCPYCGKKFESLYLHIRYVHNKNKQEVLNEFPNINFRSASLKEKIQKINKAISNRDSVRKKKSIAQHKIYEDEANRKYISEKSKELWVKDGHRELVSKRVKEVRGTEESRKKTSEIDAIRWQDRNYHDKVSKKIRETQNSKDKVEHMSKVSSENLSNGIIGSYKHKVMYKGKELRLRSNLELYTFKYLVQLNISFEYEKIKIPYIDFNGNTRIYVTDFYLPEYNLLLEVKPRYKLERQSWITRKKEEYYNIKAKERYSIFKGYKYVFITEDNLIDIACFKKSLA